MNMVMYNTVIVKKDTPYDTEEGYLSLEGVRKTNGIRISKWNTWTETRRSIVKPTPDGLRR